jgi:hypothetical protein
MVVSACLEYNWDVSQLLALRLCSLLFVRILSQLIYGLIIFRIKQRKADKIIIKELNVSAVPISLVTCPLTSITRHLSGR